MRARALRLAAAPAAVVALPLCSTSLGPGPVPLAVAVGGAAVLLAAASPRPRRLLGRAAGGLGVLAAVCAAELLWASLAPGSAAARLAGGLAAGCLFAGAGRASLGDPAAETASAGGAEGFVGAGMRVGGLTLFSRFSGLLRDGVLAARFGLGPTMDAFFVAFLVPNLFRRLFGEGALAAAFVPAYARSHRDDPEAARRLAAAAVAAVGAALGGLTLAGEAALLALRAAGGWSAQTGLALELAMIMLPYMPLVCLLALLGAMLQVRGRFGPPAAAPILLNGAIVAGAAGAAALGLGSRAGATLVAGAVLAAGVIQLAALGLALRGGRPFGGPLAAGWPALRGVLGRFGPMAAGMAVFQANVVIDHALAYGLSASPEAGPWRFAGLSGPWPVEVGAVAALQWAQRLYQFPLGVFAIALATAIFPALVRARGRAFGATLERGLRLSLFIGLPASVGLFLVREPLARAVFARGAFDAADAGRVGALVAGYAVALWGHSALHVLTRACHARDDVWTPFRAGAAAVAANAVLNLALVWPLGAAGLAWSTAATGIGQTALVAVALARGGAFAAGRHTAGGLLRTAGITALMGAAVAPWAAGAGFGGLLGCIGLGVAVYAGLSWALRAPEARWLVDAFRGREELDHG